MRSSRAHLSVTAKATHRKSNQVRLAVAVLAGSGHIVQTIVFALFGHPRLATLSFAAVLVFVVMAGIVGWFSTVADRAEREAERERDRSETLLLNILPAPIAARLKDNPKTIADSFESVTVLFADLVGFTTLSARIPTEQLIFILNE